MRCLPELTKIHGDAEVAQDELLHAIENFCYDTNGQLDNYQAAVNCLQEISLEPDYMEDFLFEVNKRPQIIEKYL